MSRQSELNSYIAGLQRRLRLGAWMRGAAIFTSTALAGTILLVLALNHFAFPAGAVVGARWMLMGALASAAGFGIALPLIRLSVARAVYEAESAHPDLEQRLTTFYEEERKSGGSHRAAPFLELLAADTLAVTQYAEPSSMVPDNRLFALGGAGAACLVVLVWMIIAGPGYLGYGASLLWTGPAKNATPLYSLAVTPGNVTVRRNSDELITANVSGMRPEKVQLFAHYQSAAGWEPVTMLSQPDAGGAAAYQFVLAGLPESLEYYVAAGPLISPHFKVRVVDLPTVKDIRVTYRYPKWTGLKPVSEEHSGDLRAIEGTDAAIEVEMDRPLKDGQLMLDGGQAIQLAAGNGNKYEGSIHMEKDGAYHVGATDEGQPVRLSEDYFIATDKAQPPQISIVRPGGDYRASPIEEVTVGVKAADQFGLNDVHLHYSVNGGPDRDLSLLKAPGAKTTDGETTLPLEDFKLVPGDLVSLYATARDGHSESRTDIGFIQVDPFEREFSQSQQDGAGGGGGGSGNNNQTEISKREKELIAATWKQENSNDATPKDAATAGQFLSDAQQKLRDQVMALSARMQSRDLSEANEEFTGFDKDMQVAAAAMTPSADKLQAMQWKDAIPLEQKALQALLRAEATFRQIQVAFGQRGGGGGGGTNSAGRDLASLFDLELDTEKNQYETARSASPAEQHEKDVEDALEKLDALAKRQQDLANQQQNPQQTFQQRWQQEMLRREAEQLQRQVEQLAKNGQQDQQGQESSSGSQQGQPGLPSQQASSQRGSQGQSGNSSARQQASDQSGSSSSGQSSDQRIEQALNRLRQAGDAMKNSGGTHQNSEAARRAAQQLSEAANFLAGTQQQLASNKLDSLTREAARLTGQEHAQAGRIDKLVKAAQQADPNQADLAGMMARRQELNRLAQERQQLSDDLSSLQKNLRETARETAPNDPGVAKKLRDALTEMDESDLDNHVQRTADWLRSGIDPNSNGTENEIAQGLQKLGEQLQQAGQQVGKGKPGSRPDEQNDATATLDQVERLRSRIEEMTASRGANRENGQSGQGNAAQTGQRSGQEAGTNGQSAGQIGGLSRRTADRPGQRSGQGIGRGGDVGGQSDDVRSDGRGADGTAWNNVNTGNNRYTQPGQSSSATDSSSYPTDTDGTYQQGMRELNRLRQLTQRDPQAAREVAELARQMQQLDPSRFPGNPAMVEQMHREVLSSVDRLELQLRHDAASTDARTGKPFAIPAGYQDSVAEYYRRLSRNP
jgi:hypothetical protein